MLGYVSDRWTSLGCLFCARSLKMRPPSVTALISTPRANLARDDRAMCIT